MVPVIEQETRLSTDVAKAVTRLPEQLPALRASFTPETFPVHKVIAFLRHDAKRVTDLVGESTYSDVLRSERLLLEASSEAVDPENDVMVQRIRELTYYHTVRVLELILLSEKAGDLLARIDDIGVRLNKTEAINIVLERQVKTDPLTKLYNRDGFHEEGTRVFDYCRTKGIPLSALYIDLDYFKDVNDAHGHNIGHAVLSAFAGMIVEEFRGSDVAFQGNFGSEGTAQKNVTKREGEEAPEAAQEKNVIGRDGGEEFVVLLTYTDFKEAAVAAERLRKRLQAHFFNITSPDGQTTVLNLTCTIGVMQADFDKDDNVDALKGHADSALRAGKDEYRNVVAVRHTEGDGTRYEYPSLKDRDRKIIPKRGRHDKS